MAGASGDGVKERLRAKLAKQQGVATTVVPESEEEAERLMQEFAHHSAVRNNGEDWDPWRLVVLSETLSRCLEGKPQYRQQWAFFAFTHAGFTMPAKPRERVERLQQIKATIEREVRASDARIYLAEVEVGIANGFYEQGRYQDAEEYGRQVFKSCASLDMNPHWWVRLCRVVAEAALKSGRYGTAERYYGLAIEHGAAVMFQWLNSGGKRFELIDKCTPSLLGDLGTVYEHQGRLDEAHECDARAMEEVLALPVQVGVLRFDLINVSSMRRVLPVYARDGQARMLLRWTKVIQFRYMKFISTMDSALCFFGKDEATIGAMEALILILLNFADILVTEEGAKDWMRSIRLNGSTAAHLRDYAHRLQKDLHETKAIIDSIRLSALQETKDEMALARRAHRADKTGASGRTHPQQHSKSGGKKKKKNKKKKPKRSRDRKKADKQQEEEPAGSALPGTGGSSAQSRQGAQGQTGQGAETDESEPPPGQVCGKAEAAATTEQVKQQQQEEEEEEEEAGMEACPICEWEGDEDEEDEDEEGARVALACGHSVFHRVCLQAWSRKCGEKGLDFTCPMCRAIITSDI